MFDAQVLANFGLSLQIMWMGMLGIFAVIGLIMFTVFVLTRFGKSEQS